jgi:hypothetical protein
VLPAQEVERGEAPISPDVSGPSPIAGRRPRCSAPGISRAGRTVCRMHSLGPLSRPPAEAGGAAPLRRRISSVEKVLAPGMLHGQAVLLSWGCDHRAQTGHGPVKGLDQALCPRCRGLVHDQATTSPLCPSPRQVDTVTSPRWAPCPSPSPGAPQRHEARGHALGCMTMSSAEPSSRARGARAGALAPASRCSLALECSLGRPAGRRGARTRGKPALDARRRGGVRKVGVRDGGEGPSVMCVTTGTRRRQPGVSRKLPVGQRDVVLRASLGGPPAELGGGPPDNHGVAVAVGGSGALPCGRSVPWVPPSRFGRFRRLDSYLERPVAGRS